jgi:F-type H+-transporting ATPase subunit c
MKTFRVLAVVLLALFLLAAPAMAQEKAAVQEHSALFTKHGSAGIGAGLIIIGAAFGFGRIGAAALESMARQPEVAKDVRGTMIVAAALLEGATFFALLICLLLAVV